MVMVSRMVGKVRVKDSEQLGEGEGEDGDDDLDSWSDQGQG